jgi:hypothetical protein
MHKGRADGKSGAGQSIFLAMCASLRRLLLQPRLLPTDPVSLQELMPVACNLKRLPAWNRL